MDILIVYAHPNPRSFNKAILDLLDSTLREQGHNTQIHDLYAMQFRPVLDGEDLLRNWRGDLAADTYAEQSALRATQGLAFVYPIWWFGSPAILKGWIDRVLTRKFAFDFGQSGMRGLLGHERALIINTLGGDADTYQRERWSELLERPMVEGVLRACGVQHIAHRAFYRVPSVSDAERQAMLQEVRELALAAFPAS